MNITVDQLVAGLKVGRTHAQEHLDGLNAAMEENAINTRYRVAHFLAQCAHESAMLTTTEENLNYSWQALRGVLGKYFPTDELAQAYHRQPRRIASRIYANRMGNGDEASEDGWYRRGAGLIQLTGSNNQRAYWEVHGEGPLAREDAVAVLSSPPHASRSAGWFWASNNLNTYADRNDVLAVSGVINVGRPNVAESEVNGYAHRAELTAGMLSVLPIGSGGASGVF